MKGLELSERFYLEYGAPMIHEKFSEIEQLLAVGLVGSGSECFGYDDDISKDHDFEAGFCIFIPDESVIDRKTEFALERAYSKLPREFMGYKRALLDPVGGNRHGVIRISDFFKDKLGTPDGELSLMDWFYIPEQSLLEAVGGKVFRDDLGLFTEKREKLSYMPEDVRLKKLAGNLITMGQSGQYNYSRCISRGDTAAAQLAAFEFVKCALNAIFLLNKTYVPYYKWSFRALRELPELSHLYAPLEYLISSGNTDKESAEKSAIIERISNEIISSLKEQNLTSAICGDLGSHAYSVNDKISNEEIRNLHVMFAV